MDFATLSVIAAGVLWGIINIFVHPLALGGLDSEQISLIKMVISAVSFTAFLLIKDKSKLKIKLKDVWVFIGTGIISVTLFSLCYFYTMIHGQASVAVVLLYTSPIFIMLISSVLFKEKITAPKVVALILTFAGCILVSGLIGSSYKVTGDVLLFGILSGFFYALYTIFGRYATDKYDTLTVNAWTFIFGFIGILPFVNIPSTVNILNCNHTLIWWGLGIGIVSTVLPYFFYTWGLQRMESGKAAIMVAVEPVVGAALGMTVFNEPHNIGKIIGIIFIISAMIILNRK